MTSAFHGLKPLEDFDGSFNLSVHKKKIFALATGNFIRQAKEVLFLGPPGVGKTALAQALGCEAIKAGFAVRHRSIFDRVRDFMKDVAFNQEDQTLAAARDDGGVVSLAGRRCAAQKEVTRHRDSGKEYPLRF